MDKIPAQGNPSFLQSDIEKLNSIIQKYSVTQRNRRNIESDIPAFLYSFSAFASKL